MSRWQQGDLIKTKEELSKPTGLINGKNWLRHAGQALRIDELLLIGASKRDIAQDLINTGIFKKELKTAMARVQRHIDHIRKEEHKIPLEMDENGVWKFVLNSNDKQAIEADLLKKLTPQLDNNYLPTIEDLEIAYRMLTRHGEAIASDLVLDQIEIIMKNRGLSLKINWRLITEKNIEIWAKKK